MAKTLVTGATGFIGTHLVRELVRRGDQVVCLVRRSSSLAGLDPLGVKLVFGDVLDEPSIASGLDGVDVVYHLAGVIKAIRRKEFQRVNEGGVECVARACAAQSNPPRLVVVSSLAAAGPSTIGRPRTESDPPAPVSRYGRSKRAGELAAERWAHQVPITVVRPPIVLGEGDTNGLALFRPIARFGVHLVPGFTDARYSAIHADDLVAALMLVGEQGRRLPTRADGTGDGYYFAAADEYPTFAELGRMIGHAAGRQRVRMLRVPRAGTWAAGALVESGAQIMRRPHIFSLDKAREATAGSWTCSSELIRNTLGFAPAKPLDARLTQTLDWYRKAGWL